uniref:Alternative protein ADH6 n=1 Tax=Homo sapiens TaxID=9606 RepID=L8E8M5_HUMAN|nr:alternative protein ADH6 [Homo sapiens]
MPNSALLFYFLTAAKACSCSAPKLTLLTVRTWRSLRVLGNPSFPGNVLL